MKSQKDKLGNGAASKEPSCCEIRAVITIDERGQMVLPKEVRDEAKIKAGDKLAVIFMGHKGESCCLSLMKVEDLSEAVKTRLGPVLGDIK